MIGTMISQKNMLHVSDRYLLHAVQSHLPCKHLCQLTHELNLYDFSLLEVSEHPISKLQSCFYKYTWWSHAYIYTTIRSISIEVSVLPELAPCQ